MKLVAVLGVGRMGAAVATELSKAGHPVILWNRSREAADSLASNFANMVVVATPEEALRDADVAISFFVSGPVTESALLADPAVLEKSNESIVIVDMGTSGVETAKKLGRAATKAGRRFVDAPVSGSVSTIQNHQLLVMASGDEKDIDEIHDVLMVFAKKIVRVGEIGAGQVMKLVVNSIVHALNVAVAEGLTLASEFDLNLESVYDVLEESVIAAPYIKYKRGTFLGTNPVVAMNIDTVSKDMGLILELAQSQGLTLPLAESVSNAYTKASRAGLGDRDMGSIADSFKNK
ncbi:MAG TPA: NAD(P)-dependent oxidoreductase [Candidatus Nanopelagicaceae bacterium]